MSDILMYKEGRGAQLISSDLIEKAKEKGWKESVTMIKEGREPSIIAPDLIEKAKAKGWSFVQEGRETKPEVETPGVFETILRSAAQTVTSASDEIESKITGESVESIREKLRKGEEANPIASTVGTVAGFGAAVALPAVGASVVGGGIVAAGLFGLGYGALSGGTEAFFDLTESETIDEAIEKVTTGAAVGAGFGAVLGGAGGAIAGKLAKKAVNPTVHAIKNTPQKELVQLGEEIQKDAQAVIVAKADEFKTVNSIIQKHITSKSNNPKKWNLTQDELTTLKVLSGSSNNKVMLNTVQQVEKEVATAFGFKTKAGSAVKHLTKKLNTEPEQFNRMVNNVQEADVYSKTLKDDKYYKLAENIKDGEGMAMGVFRTFSDARPLASYIDSVRGTKLAQVLDASNEGTNAFSIRMKSVTDNINKHISKAKKYYGRVGQEEQARLFNILDGKIKVDKNSEEFIEIVKPLQDMLERGLEEAKALGINIAKRQDYVPYTLISPVQRVVKLEQVGKNLARKIGFDPMSGKVNDSDLAKLRTLIDKGDEEATTFVKMVSISSGRTTQALLKNPAMFNRKGIMEATNVINQTNRSASITARALAREGDIPREFIDTDIFSGIQRWHQSTLRQGLLEPHLDLLRGEVQKLRKMGDVKNTTYFDNLLIDVEGGVRAKTWRAFTAKTRAGMELFANRRLARAKAQGGFMGEAKASVYELISKTPDALGAMQQYMYPVVLGRLGPLITNMTQTLTTTMPELGAYGKVAVGPMMGDTLKTILKGKGTLKEMTGTLQAKGYLGSDFSPTLEMDMIRGVSKGIQVAGIDITKIPRATLKGYANTVMYMFKQTETINRYAAVIAGNNLAKDLAKGNKLALDYLAKRMDVGYARTARDLLKKNDTDGLEQLMERYMLGKTALNYNRQTMSAFGRAMGPFFSVFTKWPASMSGEIMNELLTRGKVTQASLNIARKFMAPAAFLAAADYGKDELLDLEGQEVYDHLMGKPGQSWTSPGGALGKAPILSPVSLVSGEVFSPPILDLFKGTAGLLENINKGEEAAPATMKALYKVIAPFNPVNNFYKNMETIDLFFDTEVTEWMGEKGEDILEATRD